MLSCVFCALLSNEILFNCAGNAIGDQGAIAVAEALKGNTSLRVLNLSRKN
jgi:hypothetical protein